jgi:hypothetical protein
MRSGFVSVASAVGAHGDVCLLALLVSLCGACATLQPTPSPQPTYPSAAYPGNEAETAPPLEFIAGPDSSQPLQAQTTRLDVVLRVLHVQVPHAARDQAATLWNHVREDVLDHETLTRLQQNGVRVGVSHDRWWDAVKATLDAIDGVITITLDPVRLPDDYPLALQLDARPHDQTLFYMADDGILTGETWPMSRNVLRVSCGLNLAQPEHLRVGVVPEVRQRLEGWRWVRREAGLAQIPNYEGRTFAAAGFELDLGPGEFVVVAPGERADLFGIVGGAFLVREQDGTRYDSYVFLRADVNRVAYGH